LVLRIEDFAAAREISPTTLLVVEKRVTCQRPRGTVSLQSRGRAGCRKSVSRRLRWFDFMAARLRASCSDSSMLSERSGLRARSEFIDGP